MKKILRAFVFNLVSLWLASLVLKGIKFSDGQKTILLASASLTLVNILIKPLINLLLLPVNLLTLGIFRGLVNILCLYLVTFFIPQMSFNGFTFPGFSFQGFLIPEMYLSSFWVLVLASFIISLLNSLFYWLID